MKLNDFSKILKGEQRIFRIHARLHPTTVEIKGEPHAAYLIGRESIDTFLISDKFEEIPGRYSKMREGVNSADNRMI